MKLKELCRWITGWSRGRAGTHGFVVTNGVRWGVSCAVCDVHLNVVPVSNKWYKRNLTTRRGRPLFPYERTLKDPDSVRRRFTKELSKVVRYTCQDLIDLKVCMDVLKS